MAKYFTHASRGQGIHLGCSCIFQKRMSNQMASIFHALSLADWIVMHEVPKWLGKHRGDASGKHNAERVVQYLYKHRRTRCQHNAAVFLRRWYRDLRVLGWPEELVTFIPGGFQKKEQLVSQIAACRECNQTEWEQGIWLPTTFAQTECTRRHMVEATVKRRLDSVHCWSGRVSRESYCK